MLELRKSKESYQFKIKISYYKLEKVIKDILSKRLEAKDSALSPFAVKNGQSAGRASPEDEHIGYTNFQLDRNRIVHSNSFRRLKHKTQVFIAPHGDHYVTRLTHTLEVAEVS